MRVLAIGDIHGCTLQLDALLEAMSPAGDDQIVTLGDYIDRGPDSAGVMNRLLRLKRSYNLIPLLGNHELMFLKARTDRDWYAGWMKNGGDETLRSYGMKPDTPPSALLSLIPREHVEFFENDCRDFYETDTHFFVHANAHPEAA